MSLIDKTPQIKIATIIGTRPQFIKAAIVSRCIIKNGGIREVIIHTGQHYDKNMSSVFFDELKIPVPKYNLCIGSSSHGKQTGQMIYEIEKVLLKENPHFVLLYGDTNSTVSGAIAASKIPIKIAHVEAGLRSFNRRMPEEVNRVLTDHISDLLFCPTKTAVANLKKEGIEKGVYLVGDVMYDSILYNKISADIKKQINDKLHISGTGRGSRYIIATVHRAENTDHISRLSAIFSAMSKIPERIILPLHPRTYKIIKKNKLSYGKNIEIIEPLAYKEMLCLIKNAYMVMTDSGGIQKEAFMFGTPCITLREETEWLETVKAGMNKLAGHAEEEILRSYNDFKLNAPKLPTEANKYYGDADAAQRIIDILKK